MSTEIFDCYHTPRDDTVLTSSVAVAQVREAPQVSHADCEAEGRHDKVQLPSPRPAVRVRVFGARAPAVARSRRRKLIFVLEQENINSDDTHNDECL